jgi:hypothetical protein
MVRFVHYETKKVKQCLLAAINFTAIYLRKIATQRFYMGQNDRLH